MPCEEFRSEARWICVRTQSKKEFFAAQNLRNQSYDCYLPTVARTIRHARRARVITAPLFPGYLFVSLELDVRQWRPILGTFGVIDLIMEDGCPKPVPVGVVEALQEATGADGHADFRHQVSVGQDVRIMSGPFFSLVGRLERLDDQGRVTVLLDILGGQRLVSADATALQPLAA
ncbi:MAG: transcriptional activator RfaH [Rhodospirillales bacterium]|nr:transcriptional activator RfaH [Rhodospirillales bacterium]